MGWHSLRMSSSLDEGRSGKFPGFIVPALVTFGLRPGARLPGLSLPEVVLVLSLWLATFGLPHSGSVH